MLAAGLLNPPPVAFAADETFPGIHLQVSAGKKAKQVKARLVLEDDSVRAYGQRGTGNPKRIPYSELKAATYSRSKYPRWKTMAVAAAAVGLFAIPLAFMKGNGLAGDDIAALVWLGLARVNGEERAQEAWEVVRARLTSD